MGGKATLVDRVLEAVRQRDLTNRLGQPHCGVDHSITDIQDCPKCGAIR